jgi:asparagine synthetase B (glutamine-hydrolysing)
MEQEEKIDIYHSKEKYQRYKQRFYRDESVSQRNKKLIISFLDDCQLGKTLRRRQKKLIKERRLFKHLYHPKFVARCLRKNFDKLTIKDMEESYWARKELPNKFSGINSDEAI